MTVQPVRILLADDSRTMRALIRASFPKNAYRAEFVEAEDGGEAIAAYRERRCDIALLDVAMPVVDGLGVLQAIRGYDRDAFVVIVSGSEDPAIKASATALGAVDFVTKPITQEAMQRIADSYRARTRRPVSVLAADDSPTMLAMLKRGLEILGTPHRMVTAKDGQEAGGVFGRSYFDIVFLDVHMPAINGLDLLREIKSRRKNAYVVMCTADATPDAVRQAKTHGADDYLLKPVDPVQFKKVWSRFKVMAGQEFLG
ncbi:response regulator [Azospirillum sp. sgz301742]